MKEFTRKEQTTYRIVHFLLIISHYVNVLLLKYSCGMMTIVVLTANLVHWAQSLCMSRCIQ